MKLIGIGDNVVDFYKDQGKIYPGGNSLNVAVLCNRLNDEQSSYIGIVGNDGAADHVLEALQKEKIEISRVRQAVGENGMAVVALDKDGDRIFIGSNKGGIQSRLGIVLNDKDLDYIRQHDLLHTSVYSRIEHNLPILSQFIEISFDFSTNQEDHYLQKVCPFVNYAFFSGSNLNEAECNVLIQKVHSFGTKVICVTRGEKGALLSTENQIYEQAIIQTKVVDTLGAGDSFIAGFLSSYVQGQDVYKALQKGASVASQTCQDYGAFGYGKVYNPDHMMV
ncbi:fructoselysine 6-kinase [Bacillus sp. BA3]|uniref:PfkB family carbohydrate kinase n=1 Tax=Bacillus sp. BA3 TaxID=2057910 RepID=UPI000C33C5F1|nr:PfkB family carbohydrate kinase [Bacillus sp. BA3]PKF88643.1 fructoselysine 6-kinase [Bacillus sp. BA3]